MQRDQWPYEVGIGRRLETTRWDGMIRAIMNLILGSLILIIVTSASQTDSGKTTGIWLEEFAVPYQMFVAAGHEVTVASPRGGVAPVDPRSTADGTAPANAKEALAILADTRPLAEIDLTKYDAVFFPGGHGTMFDLPTDPHVRRAVGVFLEADKPAAFVCHGPAALTGARNAAGVPYVKGRKVTGFTNEEEDAVNLTADMPFLLETKLKELGGTFSGAPAFQAHTVTDGNLITGQNPASSAGAAQALLDRLKRPQP